VSNFVGLLDKLKSQKFIYASSASVYSNTNKKRITEDYSYYVPGSYYDLTKKEIDFYSKLSKINYYGLRLGTVCGYSPNFRNDVMINRMIESARKNNLIELHNPSIYRPILGINDLLRAIESIIKKNKPIGIYNLASINSSVKNISGEVNKAMGGKIDFNIVHRYPRYNFSISTKKFEKTFDFQFKENTTTIINSILKNSPIFNSSRDLAPKLD
jgi:nucleoside-diphosphate-sugar epimerase